MKKLVMVAAILISSSAFASINVYPFSIYFPNQEVGTRSFQESVTITNGGPFELRTVNISGSCYGAFDVTPSSCYGPLQPYQSCSLYVTFAPYSEGYQSCSINVYSDVGSDYVSVSGVGTRRLTSEPSAKLLPRVRPFKFSLLKSRAKLSPEP